MKQGILFVCWGNICRSPMAESICRHYIEKERLDRHFRCDSAGTMVRMMVDHQGEMADRRALACLSQKGMPVPSRARRIVLDDFQTYDYILAMDKQNYNDLMALVGEKASMRARVSLLGAHDPECPDSEVPDPYFGEENGFEAVYNQIKRSVYAFLSHIRTP